jgi:hypothetical protein
LEALNEGDWHNMNLETKGQAGTTETPNKGKERGGNRASADAAAQAEKGKYSGFSLGPHD